MTSADDRLGAHAGQHLVQGGIAAPGDVLLDALRIDETAVPQGDLYLLFEEGDFIIPGDLPGQLRGMGIGVRPEGAFDDELLLVDAAQGVVLEDFPGLDGRNQSLGLLRRHGLVADPHLLGVDHVHQGLFLAETDAAGLLQDHVQPELGDFGLQGLPDLVGARPRCRRWPCPP